MDRFAKYSLSGAFGLVVLSTIWGMSLEDGSRPAPSSAEQPVEASFAERKPEPPQIDQVPIKAHRVAACKAALALMNDRDVRTFSGYSLDENTAQVKWRNPDDGKTWQARCEAVGKNRLRWAAFNAFGDGKQGRWRDEDTIIAKVEGGRLSVSLTQMGIGEKAADHNIDALT